MQSLYLNTFHTTTSLLTHLIYSPGKCLSLVSWIGSTQHEETRNFPRKFQSQRTLPVIFFAFKTVTFHPFRTDFRRYSFIHCRHVPQIQPPRQFQPGKRLFSSCFYCVYWDVAANTQFLRGFSSTEAFTRIEFIPMRLRPAATYLGILQSHCYGDYRFCHFVDFIEYIQPSMC